MKQQHFLIQQLKEFGLNPQFWRLHKLKQKHTWLLVHKQNQDLKLKGISSKKKQWLDLMWLC